MALNNEQKQGLIDSIVSILTKNMTKIAFALMCIFFGIIISWKAERGACLINCNFTDNSKHYFFREKDINQEDIIDMLKKE